ncbi:MAG TPA: adenylate/guanylate cyclase domain-containing protein, partial [Mycobacterium sp.]|nr:adenylate/guanylate cyclase domain-containing protein [Mycobacterium sp.]
LFKHTGDGVCAAFESPSAAVSAAIEAQRALQLPVRMGLATGEADLREGDYFGPVLNRAARVMAAGHGGQILLTDSTAVHLDGVDLAGLGPRRLRDVPSPVEVFQVRAPGLRSEFPPLRTVDATPGNLRPAITSLIGRDLAVAELEAAVRAHRLVTLTGPGGVGKTRLALEVATRLADEFADGVWVFELAAVADPAAVPDAVAATLGVAQQPGKTVTESVADALVGRVRLLVFDNCEHVRDAAADLVEAILARAATVKVVATSREGLSAADEQVWLVPSLDVSGADSAAAALFADRARSVSTGFSATGSEAAAVVEITRRVDGIPLAIELAASRMASMTAVEVRDRLDQRFRLLVGSRRGLERHQTLRHAVQWSYDLLSVEEKTLLERCSVFVGGFDLEGARAVTHSDDEFATLDVLDSLVRKSLLVADRASGHTRFSILETIRQFAEEQLAAHGAATDARDTHARYFAGQGNATIALWDSLRQPEAYDWFATELPNLRAAFRWAADQGDLDSVVAIVSDACFLGAMVEVLEPVAWAEQLIEPARAAGHPRFAALCGFASLCYQQGRIDDALLYSAMGQNAKRPSITDVVFDAGVLWLGAVYSFIGDPVRNVEFYSNELSRGHDTLMLKRMCVVVALANASRWPEAQSLAAGMTDAADTTNNPYVIAYALLADGMARRKADPLGALESLRRGMRIAAESGNLTMAT